MYTKRNKPRLDTNLQEESFYTFLSAKKHEAQLKTLNSDVKRKREDMKKSTIGGF